MQIIEDIFYTNLTEDLTQFILAIKQKEIIDKYTIFIIFNEHGLNYNKYWKHHDCSVLRLKDDTFPEFSNNKYSHYLIECEKYFDLYGLLDKYIKFTHSRSRYYCNLLNTDLEFSVRMYLLNHRSLIFKHKYYTVEEFITEIQENYPEFYKYDYSQIKPAICE